MPLLLICFVGLLVAVDVRPASSSVISGQVRRPDGLPVAGAQVVLFDVADLRRGPVGQATTDETGQFALPLASGTSMLPSEVGLGPNYPNPFNPSTIIPYQLSASSPVRLEVFNLLGQRVATLVDGQQGAGSYLARWDGTDAAGRAAASGVYFYRLTVDGAHWTGKMVLVDGQAGVPLGGGSGAAVSRVAGSSATYGLVVSGAGLVPYVDADFGVSVGSGPVEVMVLAAPSARGKVVAPLEGVLGDVNADSRVDMDDGLLVAMYSVDPGLLRPHHGLMTLGDVNCDGRVELEDAALIGRYVDHPADEAVASLRIGQPGGYSLDPVTEIVWGSILGNEQQDAVVARLLDGVPVLVSGVMPIDGEDRLYLGIDRAWWTQQGGKQIYEALKQRFPATPIHVRPSTGIIKNSGKVRSRPTTTAIRTVAPVTLAGPPRSFAESPHAALEGTKQQHVVGRIRVPDDVTVGTVSVAVDITHPFTSDLKIELVAPSGVATTLYDGIRDGISSAEANFIGELPMSTALQGQAAQGLWQLRVGDYARRDAGTLNAWTLTVTPAQATAATQEPVNLFLETFQDGLDAWRTTAWQAASLDTDTGVPGEGPGNVVAKAEGCTVCFLTLETPVDLSAYDSVTLSFYRWMDPGASNVEFLGIDIGNNGAYRRLENWGNQHADGQWHLETFTLSGDDISDVFSLRFFGIAANDFTTFAIDNVMITAAPGSVVVEPVPPGTEEDPDVAATEQSTDFSISYALTPRRPVQSGNSIALYTEVTNTGTASTEPTTARLYRHTRATSTPTIGGVPGQTAAIPALEENQSVFKVLRSTAPTVSSATTYYYYVCVEDSCSPVAPVVVQPAPDPEEPEPETTAPALSVTDVTATPQAVRSTDIVTIQATITNTGNATADATDIHIYRNRGTSFAPRSSGTREANTATTGTLAPNASVKITSTHRAPTVSETTKYSYYICIGEICGRTPAEVVVRAKPEDPGNPPYELCDVSRNTPMGGDFVLSDYIHDDHKNLLVQCTTITLGGVETDTGERGFIMSGHAVANTAGYFAGGDPDYTSTDFFVGHGKNEDYTIQHLLGKVFRMPTIRIEGEKKVIAADAAFAIYPNPKTPGCSLTWTVDQEEFCFDSSSDNYLERAAPLKIRGAGDTVYTVIGSKEPTEGMEIWFSGAVSGTPKRGIGRDQRLLNALADSRHYMYINYTAGDIALGGDSGSPMYTAPDANGNTYVVGILRGDYGSGITFSTWNDVEQGLNLKPISAPAPDSPPRDEADEEDEADLEGLLSAFD